MEVEVKWKLKLYILCFDSVGEDGNISATKCIHMTGRIEKGMKWLAV